MTKTVRNDRFVRQQIGRLLQKEFAPTEKALMDEVVRAVIESAEDDTHIVAIIDRLIATPGRFPEPATFRQVAGLTRCVEMVPSAGCPHCGGCGWVTTSIGGQSRRFRCQCGGDSGCIVCRGTGEFEALIGAATGSTKCSCWRSVTRSAGWMAEA